MLPEWSMVSTRFPFCDDGPRSVAVARAAFGARGSAGPASCTVSGLGHCAGGGDQAVEFLSPGSPSATARLAPAWPWSLGDLRCRWSRHRSLLPLPVGAGGGGRDAIFGGSDSSLAQGWRPVGGRSGVAGSWSGSTGADVRSTFQVPAFSSDDSCDLKALRCSPSQVLWRLAFFFLSGVAGDGGRQVVCRFSVAVAFGLCIRLYVPAYVCRIVLSFL